MRDEPRRSRDDTERVDGGRPRPRRLAGANRGQAGGRLFRSVSPQTSTSYAVPDGPHLEASQLRVEARSGCDHRRPVFGSDVLRMVASAGLWLASTWDLPVFSFQAPTNGSCISASSLLHMYARGSAEVSKERPRFA